MDEKLIDGLVSLFRLSPHSELRGVLVRKENDTVVLDGMLSSFYLKQTAQELVRSQTVAAGMRLRNLIVVVGV